MWRETDGGLRVGDFALDGFWGDGFLEEGGGSGGFAAGAGVATTSGGGDAHNAILGGIHDAAENQKPAMIPCAVIPHVVAQKCFDQGKVGVPEGKVAYEPLSVGPDVVVFYVFGEHEG